MVPQNPKRPTQAALGFSDADYELLGEMTRRGIAEKKARELVAHLQPGQEVMDQLEYVDSLIDKDKRGKLENPPGLYVFYVRDNIASPSNFCSRRKARLHDEAQQVTNSDLARKARLEIDYEEYRSAEIRRFAEALPAEEYKRIYEQQRRLNRSTFRIDIH